MYAKYRFKADSNSLFLHSQVDVMREWCPNPIKWLFIRFESGPDYISRDRAVGSSLGS